MLELFPDMFLLADARVDARLPQVYMSLQRSVERRGKYNPQVDALVALLNQSLDEKKRLEQEAQQNEDAIVQQAQSTVRDATDATDFDKNTALLRNTNNSIADNIRKMHERRLAEIDSIIASIQSEFHQLTHIADLVPTKIVRPTSKLPKRRHRSNASRKAEERQNLVVSIDTCSRMLRCALVSHHSEVLCAGIGSVDVNIGLVAFGLFGVRSLAFQCTQMHKKQAAARVARVNQQLVQHTTMLVRRDLQLACDAKISATDWLQRLRSTVVRRHGTEISSELHAQLARLYDRFRAAKTTGKATTTAKIVKLLHQLMYRELVPLEPMTDAVAKSIIDRCQAFLTNADVTADVADADNSALLELLSDNRSFIVVISASYLWDLCFKPEKQSIFQALTCCAQQHANRYAQRTHRSNAQSTSAVVQSTHAVRI
jgi:hypothetical protein